MRHFNGAVPSLNTMCLARRYANYILQCYYELPTKLKKTYTSQKKHNSVCAESLLPYPQSDLSWILPQQAVGDSNEVDRENIAVCVCSNSFFQSQYLQEDYDPQN